METKVGGTNQKTQKELKILAYDPKAPVIFKDIKDFLCKIIPFPVEVEHIGSTAVVGLGGKGVIDILIMTKKESMMRIVESLESNGYKFNPEPGFGVFPERYFISGPYPYRGENLHVHYHITFHGSSEHIDHVLFRDYLREHPDEADRYFALKKKWAIEANLETGIYTELKTPYVAEVLKKARTEEEKRKQRLLRRKVWLRPLYGKVKPGNIVEFGCGSGFVLEDLSKEFPDSSIIGIDKDQERLNAVDIKNLPNVRSIKADITAKVIPDESTDTILYVGVLHEIFSLSGRGKVLETLKLGRKALKDDGVLIIQDFLKPSPRQVTLTFKNQKTRDRFIRYAKEFRLWTVKYDDIADGVKLDIVDAVEFLTKYQSPSEEDWKIEMGESHHYFTLDEFNKIADEAGFIVKSSTKLLNTEDYFLEIRKDVEFNFDESERAWIQLVLMKKKDVR